MPAPAPQPLPERMRVSLDLTPPLVLLLDHVSSITGIPRTALITQALLEALPAHLERFQLLQAAVARMVPEPPVPPAKGSKR